MNENTIGIIGGIGAIASAEFLKTIYECCGSEISEQNMPKVLLISDPAAPARNEKNITNLSCG